MGEKHNQPFQFSFNPSLRVDFQGSRVTSDSVLLLVGELDERLGLSSLIAEHLMDDWRGKNTQLALPDLPMTYFDIKEAQLYQFLEWLCRVCSARLERRRDSADSHFWL